MITFRCPQCGFVIKADSRSAGQIARCNKCNERVRIPFSRSHPPRTRTPSPDSQASAMTGPRRRIPLFIGAVVLLAGAIIGTVLLVRPWSGTILGQTSVAPFGDSQGDQVREPEPMPLKGSLSGGVWLTRKNGSSEIIRGLNVYVFKALVEKRTVANPLGTFEKKALSAAELWRSPNARTIYADAMPEQLAGLANDAEKIAKEAHEYLQMPDTSTLELQRIYDLVVSLDRLWEQSEAWCPASLKLQRLVRVRELVGGDLLPTLLSSTVFVTKASTGIDGKYLIGDLGQTQYCLYALYNTDVFVIEWLVKVDVIGGEARANLSNDNASIIINRPS